MGTERCLGLIEADLLEVLCNTPSGLACGTPGSDNKKTSGWKGEQSEHRRTNESFLVVNDAPQSHGLVLFHPQIFDRVPQEQLYSGEHAAMLPMDSAATLQSAPQFQSVPRFLQSSEQRMLMAYFDYRHPNRPEYLHSGSV